MSVYNIKYYLDFCISVHACYFKKKTEMRENNRNIISLFSQRISIVCLTCHVI